MMSFVQFVISRRAGSSPRGDFIRDTRRLVSARVLSPDDSESAVADAMASRSACFEAREAFNQVVREFRAKR